MLECTEKQVEPKQQEWQLTLMCGPPSHRDKTYLAEYSDKK